MPRRHHKPAGTPSRRAALAAAVALSAAIAAAGCGSCTDPAPSGALTTTAPAPRATTPARHAVATVAHGARADRLDAICAAADHRYAHALKLVPPYFDPRDPTAQDLRAYGRASAGRIAVDQWIAARVDALVPASGSAAWKRAERVIDAFEANNVAQVRAARAGDHDGFVRAFTTTSRLNDALHDAGPAIGLDLTSPCAAIM
jgi:hypothetical protein